jgi:hypothetical protein
MQASQIDTTATNYSRCLPIQLFERSSRILSRWSKLNGDDTNTIGEDENDEADETESNRNDDDEHKARK